jgi:hypothetical protein
MMQEGAATRIERALRPIERPELPDEETLSLAYEFARSTTTPQGIERLLRGRSRLDLESIAERTLDIANMWQDNLPDNFDDQNEDMERVANRIVYVIYHLSEFLSDADLESA